jgi:hypothetical protein
MTMLSPRLSDWRSYLESVPVASDAFMSDVEDLVHERGGVMLRYVRDTDTFFDVMKRSHPTLLKRLQAARLARVHSMITRAELLNGVELSRRRAQAAGPLAAYSVTSTQWTSREIRHLVTPRSAKIVQRRTCSSLGLTLKTNT